MARVEETLRMRQQRATWGASKTSFLFTVNRGWHHCVLEDNKRLLSKQANFSKFGKQIFFLLQGAPVPIGLYTRILGVGGVQHKKRGTLHTRIAHTSFILRRRTSKSYFFFFKHEPNPKRSTFCVCLWANWTTNVRLLDGKRRDDVRREERRYNEHTLLLMSSHYSSRGKSSTPKKRNGLKKMFPTMGAEKAWHRTNDSFLFAKFLQA